MSIYSGFGTRAQQHYYDQLLYNMISTLLTRITKFYRNQPIDEGSFLHIITRQHRMMKKLEQRKYLEPKYASLLYYFLMRFQNQGTSGEQLVGQNQLQMPTQQQQSWSMSMLERELQALREEHEKMAGTQGKRLRSQGRIGEKVKKYLKRKDKKNSTSKIDIGGNKNEKIVQLPLLASSYRINPKKKNKIGYSTLVTTEGHSEREEEQHELQTKQKMLTKRPKFRAKMFYLDM